MLRGKAGLDGTDTGEIVTTVCVILENRCLRTPDGRVWTNSGFSYGFFSRYLSAFDHVRAVARVMDVDEVPAKLKRADGDGVEFAAVPYYIGPLAFVKRAHAVSRAVQDAVHPDDAVILRVPSNLANCLMPVLYRRKQPYAVEVVGDPLSVYSAGAVRHPLRQFFRWWFHNQQLAQCRDACAASYVTQHVLQQRYPCAGFTTGISSVELPPPAFAGEARTYSDRPNRPARVVTVGSLEQMYKGVDVLMRAVEACRASGLELELRVVGDGRHRPELEQLAQRCGLAEAVTFCGQLPAGEQVRAELDSADLFVLASRSEGLPRAMLEAMARALPCLGTAVGGIPELLAEHDLVPPGDHRSLSAKIEEVLRSPTRLAEMSRRNLATAGGYSAAILSARRQEFYRHVRACLRCHEAALPEGVR